MSILQYKPMGILIISKMVPNLRICYLNQLKLTYNTSIVWYDWSPLRRNSKTFAASAVLGPSLWVPGGKTA